jgi:hypothetical protein
MHTYQIGEEVTFGGKPARIKAATDPVNDIFGRQQQTLTIEYEYGTVMIGNHHSALQPNARVLAEEHLTLNEAAVAELAEREDVDASNAIWMLRNALQHLAIAARGSVFQLRHVDEIDSIMIHASANGRIDIYKEPAPTPRGTNR